MNGEPEDWECRPNVNCKVLERKGLREILFAKLPTERGKEASKSPDERVDSGR